MTRRSKREIERRLESLETQPQDPNGWRAQFGLPSDAGYVEGWRAYMQGRGDREARLVFFTEFNDEDR